MPNAWSGLGDSTRTFVKALMGKRVSATTKAVSASDRHVHPGTGRPRTRPPAMSSAAARRKAAHQKSPTVFTRVARS
jgi:hypothetical protein